MKTAKKHKIFMNSDTAKKCMKVGFAPRLRDDRKFLKTLIRITNIVTTFPKVLGEKGVTNSMFECINIVAGKVEKSVNGRFKLNDIEYKVFYDCVKSLLAVIWDNRDRWTDNQRHFIESVISNSAKLSPPSTNPDFQDPFADYKISDKSLHPDLVHSTKSVCPVCKAPKTLYCPHCYQIVSGINFVPRVQLPVLLDVVFHPNVSSKNSTSVHAKLLCPDDVQMYKNLNNLPDYDAETTYVLFPSSKSVTFNDLTIDELNNIKRVILIESSWDAGEKMLEHKNLQNLKHLKLLPMKKTLYWRDHHFGSDGVCTIEAIYYFYRQYFERMNENYDGRFDDLLFYFRVGFQKALLYYKQNNLIAPLQWAQ